MPKDLLRVIDWDAPLIGRTLDLGAEMKAFRRDPCVGSPLGGLAVATIYEKPSTRTKVSFEVGIRELGAQVVEMTKQTSQLSRGEALADTARTLERYVDAIVYRAMEHASVVELARWTRVPVVNALTDLHHPCQILSDLLTIKERFGDLRGIPIAFIGNGSNIAHCLLGAAARLGLTLTVATPEGAQPHPGIIAEALDTLSDSGAGGSISLTTDPRAAATGAAVVYTDVWFDMGKDDPETVATRAALFEGFQVNRELLSLADPDAVVMHCLPAQRGREATDEVLDGPQSVIFDQAENRLHTQKAILRLLLGR